MEEKIIKESKAIYFVSAVKALEGYLIMTNKRIMYSGTQLRTQFDHGVVGNVVRDKMEKAMGYDNPKEEYIFDIPVSEVSQSLKRFGFSKRLLLTDKEGNQYKLTIYSKTEREEWPEAIESAKK